MQDTQGHGGPHRDARRRTACGRDRLVEGRRLRIPFRGPCPADQRAVAIDLSRPGQVGRRRLHPPERSRRRDPHLPSRRFANVRWRAKRSWSPTSACARDRPGRSRKRPTERNVIGSTATLEVTPDASREGHSRATDGSADPLAAEHVADAAKDRFRETGRRAPQPMTIIRFGNTSQSRAPVMTLGRSRPRSEP